MAFLHRAVPASKGLLSLWHVPSHLSIAFSVDASKRLALHWHDGNVMEDHESQHKKTCFCLGTRDRRGGNPPKYGHAT